MKPKMYVKLLKDNFSKDILLSHLFIDFESLVEFHLEKNWSISQFHNIVKQIQEKYNNISYFFPNEMKRETGLSIRKLKGRNWNRHELEVLTPYPKEENIWQEFFNRFVIPIYNKTCKKELDERYKIHRKENYIEKNFFNNFTGFAPDPKLQKEILSYLFEAIFLTANSVPEIEFNVLGIAPTKDLQEIKKAFRAKALEKHPDKGGSNKDMIELIEARKICENYAFKNQTETK